MQKACIISVIVSLLSISSRVRPFSHFFAALNVVMLVFKCERKKRKNHLVQIEYNSIAVDIAIKKAKKRRKKKKPLIKNLTIITLDDFKLWFEIKHDGFFLFFLSHLNTTITTFSAASLLHIMLYVWKKKTHFGITVVD